MVIKEKWKLAINMPLLCSWHWFQLKFAHVWLYHKFLGCSPKPTKRFFSPMWLCLDYSESQWPRNRWFSSITEFPRDEKGDNAFRPCHWLALAHSSQDFLLLSGKKGKFQKLQSFYQLWFGPWLKTAVKVESCRGKKARSRLIIMWFY